MNYLPPPELREILLPSYSPCPGFRRSVVNAHSHLGIRNKDMCLADSLVRWGSLDEVQVVILVAEPGDPHSEESYVFDDSLMTQTSKYAFNVYQTGKDLYHRNLRFLINLVFPKATLEQQLRKTWIADTYLCSARKEGDSVPRQAERECAERFLAKQLELLKDRPVVALGGKAQRRAKPYSPNLIKAYSVAPPGCNRREARPSWEAAAHQGSPNYPRMELEGQVNVF